MADLPVTTIVPFGDVNQLPACAAACGHLYDANGACVPPAAPQNQPNVYTSCFCADPRVAPFSTTTAGVCDSACTADPDGLASITAWFHSVCDVTAANNPASTKTGKTASTRTQTGAPTETPTRLQNQGPGGTWVSNHWQWVIMLVVLVVAIAGTWIGACIWRRRYIRKRDLRASNPPLDSDPTGIPMTQPKPASSTPLPTFISTVEKRTSPTKWFSK